MNTYILRLIHSQVNKKNYIDYRIYDPGGDGESKLDHVCEMLAAISYQKQPPFGAVLMVVISM
jgi:hypothetical protein